MSKPITLTEAEFYKLLCRLHARDVAKLRAAQEIADADAKAQAYLTELATIYGFDPKGNYRADEASLSLVRAE